MELSDTVALVTGGASGLGEAVVRMVVAAGGRAAILDLPGSGGAELARALGDAAAQFDVDVSVPAQVEHAVDAAADRFGRVGLLVNCAGISPVGRTLDRERRMLDLDAFRAAIDVNLIGLYDVVRHAARRMARNAAGADGERGLIVNTSSLAAYDGGAGQTGYAASKGAIIALTLPLARDLAPWGIRVMTIAPGLMDTAMFAQFTDAQRDAMARLHLFPKRIGRPEEFAQLVRTCVENRMLNAEVLRLDAGARVGNN